MLTQQGLTGHKEKNRPKILKAVKGNHETQTCSVMKYGCPTQLNNSYMSKG